MDKKYYTYVVECFDGSLYTGYTTNLERRVNEHNYSKRGAKYTKTRRPVKLVYYEVFANLSDACKKEYEIKSLTRNEKLRLISNQTKNDLNNSQ